MNRSHMLFTAPFDFLPDKETLGWIGDITFREVWQLDDLPADQDFTAWIPNPGQHFVINDAVFARYPKLRVIATPSTGTNHIDLLSARRIGIEVFGLLDDREALDAISASAEFTFLSVLNALRRIDVGYSAISSGEWRDDEDKFRGHELEGSPVGLIGFGRIGSRLGRYFSAFDCSISTYDPYVENIPPYVNRVSTLSELFKLCRVVVTCCVLNDETKGLVTAEHVRMLRPGAVLVNTSRGEVWREQEIADVVRIQRSDIRLVVDVVEGEVTGTHLVSPLIQLHKSGQALVTPHIAGATIESQTKAARSALQAALRLGG